MISFASEPTVIGRRATALRAVRAGQSGRLTQHVLGLSEGRSPVCAGIAAQTSWHGRFSVKAGRLSPHVPRRITGSEPGGDAEGHGGDAEGPGDDVEALV